MNLLGAENRGYGTISHTKAQTILYTMANLNLAKTNSAATPTFPTVSTSTMNPRVEVDRTYPIIARINTV